MPILKQLVSNSAHSKRRSRADLTAEMISAPLGDFRHTMHVGRAGDHPNEPMGAGPCLLGGQGPCQQASGRWGWRWHNRGGAGGARGEVVAPPAALSGRAVLVQCVYCW
uniref:CRIB domain-containing protein n=1 Tax=Anas platyrhynchos platyrhynchos TaxID=8840 RepID=A0A493TYV7_ANAPP